MLLSGYSCDMKTEPFPSASCTVAREVLNPKVNDFLVFLIALLALSFLTVIDSTISQFTAYNAYFSITLIISWSQRSDRERLLHVFHTGCKDPPTTESTSNLLSGCVHLFSSHCVECWTKFCFWWCFMLGSDIVIFWQELRDRINTISFHTSSNLVRSKIRTKPSTPKVDNIRRCSRTSPMDRCYNLITLNKNKDWHQLASNSYGSGPVSSMYSFQHSPDLWAESGITFTSLLTFWAYLRSWISLSSFLRFPSIPLLTGFSFQCDYWIKTHCDSVLSLICHPTSKPSNDIT